MMYQMADFFKSAILVKSFSWLNGHKKPFIHMLQVAVNHTHD
jgi:hypothetical protein